MDWIDEKLDKLSKWIGNLSLRKALAVYIILCILIVALLYTITMAVCHRWDQYIWSWHGDTAEASQLGENVDIVLYHDYSMLTKEEAVIARIIAFISTWSIFIYSLGGIIGFSLIFYNIKLKRPLRILKEATDKVGYSNLDFEIHYPNKDEMGDLCQSFDLMRRQLIMNNKKMWDMMEEQKRLNAAFAHDLRTPLTVLRGYTDFLSEYIPQGKVSQDKLLSTLSMMSNHINRLEKYSNTMKEIHSFEDIKVIKKHIEGKSIVELIREYMEVLNGRNGIGVHLSEIDLDNNKPIFVDQAIYMEVFENLVSNALRYAKTEINISLSMDEEERLLLLVADDGIGFGPKDLVMATKPYYTNGNEEKEKHFGIGLYICKILCEKHEGWISLSNRMKEGAIITAAFYVGEKEEENRI